MEAEQKKISAELPTGLTFSKVTDQAVNIREAVDEFMLKFFMALGVMLLVHNSLPEDSSGEVLINLLLTALAGGACYVAIMRVLNAPELERIVSVVRRERSA